MWGMYSHMVESVNISSPMSLRVSLCYRTLKARVCCPTLHWPLCINIYLYKQKLKHWSWYGAQYFYDIKIMICRPVWSSYNSFTSEKCSYLPGVLVDNGIALYHGISQNNCPAVHQYKVLTAATLSDPAQDATIPFHTQDEDLFDSTPPAMVCYKYTIPHLDYIC